MNLYEKYIKNSIRGQISFYFAVAFIIMSIFLLFITQKYSKIYLYDLAEDNSLLSTTAETEFLDNQIFEQKKIMDDFIKQTEWYLERYEGEGFQEEVIIENPRTLANLEFFHENNSEIFEQVFLITPDLKMYTYSKFFEIDLPVDITANQYDIASKNDLSIISESRISRYSGDPIFSITRGINYDQNIIGIIGSTINLEKLSSDFLGKINNNEINTYVVRDGKYVVHKNPEKILEKLDFDVTLISDSKGQLSFSDKEVFYVSSKEIPNGYLFREVSHSELYGEIDKYMFVLLAMLITSLIIVIILGYFAAKKITDPIITLKEAMDKATNGDFFAKAEKRTSDELGKAVDSFNYLMERIRTLTFFDNLTHLPNYEQFKYWFGQETKKEDDLEKSYSFVLISINGFKKINEAYGIQAGDEVIIQVASRLKKLQKRLTSLTFISRFSGDEFLLFYKNIENKHLLEEEILSLFKIINSPYLYKENNIHLRFVIGGAFCDECYKNVDFHLSAASNARSIAKKEKKEYFIVSNKDTIVNSLVEIKSLENDLHSALEKGQLQVHYQPLYDNASNNFLSVEALVRYNHPERGMIPPIDFIPLAEEIGIIDKIGNFVLEQSIKDARKIEKKMMIELDIHVNISPEHLNKKNFINEILEITKKYNFSPERIWLEITEDIALFNLEQQEQKFIELKEKGFKISIDDFGTGYSSFLYLNQLSVNQIKIDKSFIINLNTNIKNYEIVKTIITLAQSLKIELVTEGVENKESYHLLKELKVNKMQGFYFAKPMDILHLEKFLSKDNK